MALLYWGDHSFDAGDTSFEELTHKWAGRWSKPHVFGRRPPGQYLGPADESLILRGTIYPIGGIGSHAAIVAMQQEAGNGQVDMLFSGAGDAFGLFRLEEVEYISSDLLPDGRPQKVRYTLHFTAADDLSGQLFAIWP